jgi:hypothetical protein
MRLLVLALCLVLDVAGATTVHAQQSNDRAFGRMASGVYLLTQKDGYLRLLTIDRDGTASQVSPQQTTVGFTAGQGAWGRSGDAEITAQIIDFDFDLHDGKPAGTTLIRYVLTFSGPDRNGFQRVAGAFAGQQYAVGQNPLDPSAKPIRRFGVEFTGQRVPAPPKK